MSQLRSFLNLKRSLKQHRVLILVLLIGAMTWIGVFSRASTDFLSSGSRPLRSGWGGVGEFDIFGLTLHYEFEGWADYDYYYQSWGQKFVNGSMPYTEGFNNTRIDGVDYNTPFFLPPLFLYLCGLGVLMGPVGIGFLISLLGYATVFPVYGIAKRLSENETVGAVSAATYLFNPLVLYHTTYQWLNPAPFVFFVVLSYYLLIQQHRVSGALAMATAILFKQIAAFFALPILGYLLRPSPRDVSPDGEPPRDSKGRLLSDTLDLAGFLKMGAIVVAYMVLWSFPYILDPSNYLYYILQRPGGVLYDSVTTLPSYNQPITFTVLLIVFGAPEWLAQIFNQGIYYTIFLLPGFLGALALCLF
ncbi:MAG: hypothetical protein ACFFCP_05965, partial [Promethearchaeota archaeon]